MASAASGGRRDSLSDAQLAEARTGATEPALGRADLEAENFSGLRVGAVLDVAEDQDGTKIVGHLVENASHLFGKLSSLGQGGR